MTPIKRTKVFNIESLSITKNSDYQPPEYIRNNIARWQASVHGCRFYPVFCHTGPPPQPKFGSLNCASQSLFGLFGLLLGFSIFRSRKTTLLIFLGSPGRGNIMKPYTTSFGQYARRTDTCAVTNTVKSRLLRILTSSAFALLHLRTIRRIRIVYSGSMFQKSQCSLGSKTQMKQKTYIKWTNIRMERCSRPLDFVICFLHPPHTQIQ